MRSSSLALGGAFTVLLLGGGTAVAAPASDADPAAALYDLAVPAPEASASEAPAAPAAPAKKKDGIVDEPAELPGENEPAPEDEGGKGKPQPRDATLKLRTKGLRGGKLKVGKRVEARGTLRPFVKGERVTLVMKRGKRTIKRKTVTVKRKKKGSKLGQFSLFNKLVKPGGYTVVATHKRSDKLGFARDRTSRFKISYPSLRQGNRSSTVKLFNRLLAKQGYVNDRGSAYDGATARAVLAFRKVNRMARVGSNAPGSIFKRLANGKGGYKLRFPNSGKHVEVDISRQVMVLAKGDKVDEIYHVSTGKPSTPTIPGTWRFYRKEPGLNNVGMYYSIYYDRGYATHGYKSVPTYPASAGCTRNPPANSVHIYNWIDIGDLIHLYR